MGWGREMLRLGSGAALLDPETCTHVGSGMVLSRLRDTRAWRLRKVRTILQAFS